MRHCAMDAANADAGVLREVESLGVGAVEVEGVRVGSMRLTHKKTVISHKFFKHF